MPRQPRIDLKDQIYHVLNRANARMQVFFEDADYRCFEDIIAKAVIKFQIRLFAFCLMPNHFHLILSPQEDGGVQKFMQWITLLHTQSWHTKNQTVGTGHLYQGRYKSFVIKNDNYLRTAIRYVERNPLKAGLVSNAEDWQFSSLKYRINNINRGTIIKSSFISPWPIDVPINYLYYINKPVSDEEDEIIIEISRMSRGRPKKISNISNI